MSPCKMGNDFGPPVAETAVLDFQWVLKCCYQSFVLAFDIPVVDTSPEVVQWSSGYSFSVRRQFGEPGFDSRSGKSCGD